MAMESNEIERRILSTLPGAQIDVEGADCDFNVTVISDEFDGLPTMKRQQRILAAFNDVLSNGDLHALSIKAHTLQEWNAKSSHLVQISL